MLLRTKFLWCAAASAAYPPLDYLALLVGYAVSGERTLAGFGSALGTLLGSLYGSLWPPHAAASLQLEPLASQR
jgi:hypothetical protein